MSNALAPLRNTNRAAPSKVIPDKPAAGVAASTLCGLSGREKAAIIVQLMLTEGARLPLQALPDHLQTALTEQIGQMRAISRQTLEQVVAEFSEVLDSIGLSFPDGLDSALSMLDGQISSNAAGRLRRIAGASSRADPWERIIHLDSDRLLPVLADESTEVGAVMLSKLSVTKAAELLGKLPGDRARRIAYAVSQTANIEPETVRRIGLSLAQQLDAVPAKAFETEPVDRVGAILNYSAAAIRDEVIRGLEDTDAAFAERVKKAIFTFANIPDRIDKRDVAKIVRAVDQVALVTAIAAAKNDDAVAAEFLLANMSQRMATGLRDEAASRGTIRDKDGEEAMSVVVGAIRELEAAGELSLLTGEDG